MGKNNVFIDIPDEKMAAIKLKINFSHWMKMTKLRKMDKIGQKKILTKNFNIWDEILRKKTQFPNFPKFILKTHQNRVKIEVLTIWQKSVSTHQNLEHETNIAVWHWSINLQKKVLLSWKNLKNQNKFEKLEQLVQKRQKEISVNLAKTNSQRILSNCGNFYQNNLYLFREKTIFNCYYYFSRWRKVARYRSNLLRERMYKNLMGVRPLSLLDDESSIDRPTTTLSDTLEEPEEPQIFDCLTEMSSEIQIPEAFHKIKCSDDQINQIEDLEIGMVQRSTPIENIDIQSYVSETDSISNFLGHNRKLNPKIRPEHVARLAVILDKIERANLLKID